MDASLALAALREAGVAGAVALALVACSALAWLLARRPALLPVLLVATLPLRLPVEVGGRSANLLVPLYLVVAAGCLAHAYRRLRRSDRRGLPRGREPCRLGLLLLLTIALYAIQSVYSTDSGEALKNLVFFYVPFLLLLALLTTVVWSRRLIVACFAVAAALAMVFAGIGFWEYATRQLLWNPKVIESNQFESYFRVNSLFFDPNIYGRFLAVVIVAVAGLLLWARRGRDVAAATAALPVLWAAIVLTFSLSSFTALLVGLAVLAALRWRIRPAIALAVPVLAILLAAAVAASGGARSDLATGRSLDRAASGRFELMQGGLEMFADRPLWGYGSGSFSERFRARERASPERATSASHTIPITIAAEQGVAGLVVYAALIFVAVRLLFGGLADLRGERTSAPVELVARAVIAAAFAAVAFHTLLYAAFLEDPITWMLLGAGIGLRHPPADARPD